jgi:hypothetical protein
VRWKPALGVLVVEWPGWYDDEEGECGAGETDVEGESDILLHVAHEEGNDLWKSMMRSVQT